MANRNQGEASFSIGDASYTLVMNNHAWALAQDALARARGNTDDALEDIATIAQRFQQGSELHAQAIFFAMLHKHHPKISSIEKAADLLAHAGEAGLQLPVVKAIYQAIGLSFPDVKDLAELEQLVERAKNPPTAQAEDDTRGSGENS